MAKTTAPVPIKLTLLKRATERTGYPYSSARDAAFRGEFRIFRSGRNEKYSRWYVDEAEFQQYLASRMERLT